jgi:hypothetical protein
MIKRARTLGVEPPKGVKVLGQWIDLHGGRAFRLVEVDDPKSIFLADLGWSDLCKIEAVPVLPLEEAMSLIPAK